MPFLAQDKLHPIHMSCIGKITAITYGFVMTSHAVPRLIIVSGPTASGKSVLAIDLAQALNGVIINGDALQVYRELDIISARPSRADEHTAPHALYGFHTILSPYAVTDWLRDLQPVLQQTWQNNQTPIIVGGTGFYLQSLLHGLASIPDVPDDVRLDTMQLYDTLGHDMFRARLHAFDPVLAERIKPNDRQRLVRAMEVYQATGKPLSTWQQQERVPLYPNLHSHAILLQPPRDILYDRINRRFLMMMEQGALDEARAVEELNPDPSLPGCKALGLDPLRRHVRGDMTLDEAIELGQTTSRQYAKRQNTWLNTQWQTTAQHHITRIADTSPDTIAHVQDILKNWLEF
jgi:tRNA dimethylallyltransferase